MKSLFYIFSIITLIAIICLGCIGNNEATKDRVYQERESPCIQGEPLYIAYATTHCEDTFYTMDHAELLTAVNSGCWWSNGKIAGYLSRILENGTIPLYRSWNGCKHFYTTDQNEFNLSLSRGYRAEGIAGYVISGQEPMLVDQVLQ
jgi:hypothetical protein